MKTGLKFYFVHTSNGSRQASLIVPFTSDIGLYIIN